MEQKYIKISPSMITQKEFHKCLGGQTRNLPIWPRRLGPRHGVPPEPWPTGVELMAGHHALLASPTPHFNIFIAFVQSSSGEHSMHLQNTSYTRPILQLL